MPRRGSNIYKRKDNRWEGRFYFKGTKKYRSVYGKTYTEARDKLRLLAADNTPVGCRKILFNAVVLNWLEERKAIARTGSVGTYSARINKHILPYFEGRRYSDVCAFDVVEFINKKLADGLSPKYVADIAMILKGAAKLFSETTGCENRLAAVMLPRVRTRETAVLTLPEQRRLQDRLLEIGDDISTGIYLSFFTGLRIGELCALQWGDIDLCERLLRVRKTVQRVATNGVKSKTAVIISEPKTETSVRIIPLPGFLVSLLEPHIKPDGIFLVSGGETPMEPRTLTRHFKGILQSAGIPDVKFHALRHTFATNCLQRNFDVKTLSEILGHANANVTMRIYVHTSLDRKKECMNLLSPL